MYMCMSIALQILFLEITVSHPLKDEPFYKPVGIRMIAFIKAGYINY